MNYIPIIKKSFVNVTNENEACANMDSCTCSYQAFVYVLRLTLSNDMIQNQYFVLNIKIFLITY